MKKVLMSAIPPILNNSRHVAHPIQFSPRSSHNTYRPFVGLVLQFSSSTTRGNYLIQYFETNIDMSTEESKRRLINRLAYRSKQSGFLELDLVLGKWVDQNIHSMDKTGILQGQKSGVTKLAIMSDIISRPNERPHRPSHEKIELESSEDKRKTKLKSFKKKAISASTKLRRSFTRKGRRSSKIMSVVVDDEYDAEELQAIDTLRQALILEELLPSKHDNFHMMLRFLKARKFDIEKTKQMWTDMIRWRKDFGADTIMEMKSVNTIRKVLGNKYQSKLLEIIDVSELPEFLGGTCKCAEKGSCMQSDKGPWNDPEIMKMVRSGAHNCSTKMTSSFVDEKSSGDEHSSSSKSVSFKLGSEGSLPSREHIEHPRLSPVHENDANISSEVWNVRRGYVLRD